MSATDINPVLMTCSDWFVKFHFHLTFPLWAMQLKEGDEAVNTSIKASPIVRLVMTIYMK